MLLEGIRTNEELAKVLGIPLANLEDIASKINTHYRIGKIKKGGKIRDSFIADAELREVHDSINQNILDKIDFPSEIMGGISRRSTAENAKKHQKKTNIARFDIQNFFPSTPPKKVFVSFRSIGIGRSPAKLLTSLATLGNLPVGFATSPKIACLVLIKLSRRLRAFLGKFGVVHTLWIDDINLSGNYPLNKLKSGVKTIVREEGYKLNPKKTGISYNRQPQFVNSINVNGSISAKKERVERVKFAIYISRKFGIENYIKKYEPGITIDELKRKMAGRIGNLVSINKSKYSNLQLEWKVITNSRVS